MDPNDPNNNNPPIGGIPSDQLPPEQPASGSQNLTLDALYGPSTPGAETPSANPPPAPGPAEPPPVDTPPTSDLSQPPPQVVPPTTPPETGVGTPPSAPQYYTQPGDMTSMDQEPTDLSTLPPTEPLDTAPPPPQESSRYAPPQDPNAQEFYNDLAPQDNTPANEPFNYENQQPAGTEPLPSGETEEPANPYAAPAMQTQSSSAESVLPPIPSRSKLPLLIAGIVVLFLITGAAAFFVFRGSSKPKQTPIPVATEAPLTCEEDPENPDCVDASPSIAPIATPSPAQTPTSSSGPKRSINPSNCNILLGAPCP